MRNLTRCYSEHAIRVSDSYCSGQSQSKRVISSQNMNMISSTQDTVTCTYKVKCSKRNQMFVKVTWSNLNDQGFAINIVDDPPCKFSPKDLQFGKIKGNKIFVSANTKIEIIWDLSLATYDVGPDPVSKFYVAVLLNSELILLLGDMEQEVEVKKLIHNISESKFSLFSRVERFSGNAVYSTRAKFFDNGTCHDIVIKCNDLILSVCIDKKNVVEVKSLKWNFRGNQSIYIDGYLVDLMWDVYEWFFNQKPGYAIFMFRPRNGLDSRLWLEDHKNEEESAGISLLICACKNPD